MEGVFGRNPAFAATPSSQSSLSGPYGLQSGVKEKAVLDGITGMATSEARIQAVMRALDLILDDPSGCDEDWTTYLRRIAIAAIEAEGTA